MSPMKAPKNFWLLYMCLNCLSLFYPHPRFWIHCLARLPKSPGRRALPINPPLVRPSLLPRTLPISPWLARPLSPARRTLTISPPLARPLSPARILLISPRYFFVMRVSVLIEDGRWYFHQFQCFYQGPPLYAREQRKCTAAYFLLQERHFCCPADSRYDSAW